MRESPGSAAPRVHHAARGGPRSRSRTHRPAPAGGTRAAAGQVNDEEGQAAVPRGWHCPGSPPRQHGQPQPDHQPVRNRSWAGVGRGHLAHQVGHGGGSSAPSSVHANASYPSGQPDDQPSGEDDPLDLPAARGALPSRWVSTTLVTATESRPPQAYPHVRLKARTRGQQAPGSSTLAARASDRGQGLSSAVGVLLLRKPSATPAWRT